MIAISTQRFSSAYMRDVTTRLFGSIWFLFLATFVGRGTFDTWAVTPWYQLLSRTCLAMFYVLLWWLIMTRPPAKAQSAGILPTIAAFVGTYLPWCVTFAARNEHAAPNMLSAIFVTVGMVLVLITVMHLGRSFSLVPQARRTVQSGPYRYIRHPLYLAEEIAVIGVVLQFLSMLTVTILVVHIAIQIARIMYEERLLNETLPDYRAYAAARWRIIPLVW